MLATSLQDFLSPPVLFVLGVAMITWTVVRLRKRSKLSSPSRPASAAPASSTTAADVREMARQIDELLVELHETSRRIAAQIDNRYTKLNALIEEADARIKRLESLGIQVDDLRSTVDRATRAQSSSPRLPTPQERDADPKYRRIYELADQGHTPREIAQQVGSPPGEIELILNLRPSPRA